MKILLKNIKIIHPDSSNNGRLVDILINNGVLESMSDSGGSSADPSVDQYDYKGCYASAGFCDLYTTIGDPGFEHREDILSVADAAIAGGYTYLCASPDNHPATQSKAQVEYIINKAKYTSVNILPIGTVTENFDGKTPSEMQDMYQAGAVAFSDMPHSIKDSGVMLRALQYVQPFNGLVITLPYDKSLVADGQVNESEVSVRMGMKGITNLSEYVIIQRDIALLKYTGGRLHIAGVSTSEGVELVRAAKKEKQNITCSVFVHHLISDEQAVLAFDSNLKVFPPLRSSNDQASLIDGLKDGTIDCISTQHTPLNIDSKNVEFEYADFGITGLETAFGLLYKRLEKELSKEQLMSVMAYKPRKIIRLEEQNSDWVIINFEEEWELKENAIRSKSKNTPYLNTPLKGRVKAVFSKGKFIKVS